MSTKSIFFQEQYVIGTRHTLSRSRLIPQPPVDIFCC